MNNKTRELLSYVCEGDIKKAQALSRNILSGLESTKDEKFKANLLRKLDAKQSRLIELPYNLKELLVAEEMTNFPENRFVLRAYEADVVKKTLNMYMAANELAEMGVSYVPAVMLHGKSGGGKTMLAKYIAFKTELPFVYVRFSNVVDSYLGNTQKNIAKIFDFAKTTPCVLCFDEIDAVGMARGQHGDVGEMNRIVIALMQELDSLPNNVIIIGTTNRHDRLDDALVRRFVIHHEVLLMSSECTYQLADKFFASAGYDTANWLKPWCENQFAPEESAAKVVSACTQKLVSDIMLRRSQQQDCQ